MVAEQPWRATAALILVGGAQHITTPALRDALKYQVPVHFVSGGGQYQGVAWNGKPGEAGWELWLLQAQRVGDAAAALQVAQSLVLARIHHQHEVLRKRNVTGQFDAALTGLKRLSQDSQQATNLESLNGFEGSAARVYFQALQALVPDELGFDGRKRRPPPDPFNALLSLGYTILYSHTESALRVAGLFPWLGFYHASRGRHAALASDLMEPFRHIVERAALDAVRRHGLTTADFFLDATGACKMHNTARRRYLALLTEAFQMPQGSRYNPQALVLSGHLAAQNRALIAWLRGRTEAFQAWRMRG